MTRLTLVAFIALTGFFYVTGKPVDETGPVVNRFADLAGQKTVAAAMPSALLTGQMASPSLPRSGDNHNFDLTKQLASTGGVRALDIPVRNPRRVAKALPRIAQAVKKTPIGAVRTASVAKPKSSQMFGQVRHKITSVSAKPLAVSYQQRFVKTTKSVLGPRLTAVLIKRELRRVGCYDGNVTSKWDDKARAAVETFNFNAGTKLATSVPVVASLERLQQATKTVCLEKPATKPTIIVRAVTAGTVASVSAIRAKQKTTAWRTRTSRQKAEDRKPSFRIIPTVTEPRYRSVGTIGPVETYDRPQYRRIKKRRLVSKKRARRLKRIRVAKRKARRRTAVRSWKRTYRRKKFGFRRTGGDFSIGN